MWKESCFLFVVALKSLYCGSIFLKPPYGLHVGVSLELVAAFVHRSGRHRITKMGRPSYKVKELVEAAARNPGTLQNSYNIFKAL